MTRVVVAAVAAALAVAPAAAAPAATVYAAASLSQVFPRIVKNARYSFAGSDQLALQIRQGAPADVYAAASPRYVESLYHDGFVRKPVVFATNRLVVLVPRSNPARIGSVYDLRRDGVKVVIGDKSVPIGSYTRRILDALGITSEVMKNVVSWETDVKGVVAKVALGEADAGFVYLTDARGVSSRTRSVPIPRRAQTPIRYELAVVKAARNAAAAQAFVHAVLSAHGRVLLRKAGFGLPPLERR